MEDENVVVLERLQVWCGGRSGGQCWVLAATEMLKEWEQEECVVPAGKEER